jgi:hypothetical protein
MSNLTEDERADVATIMRQSECYDTKRVIEVYRTNNCDVIDAICDLMSLPVNFLEPSIEESTPFKEMREILKEKNEIFHNR